jgi:hypothetical protein
MMAVMRAVLVTRTGGAYAITDADTQSTWDAGGFRVTIRRFREHSLTLAEPHRIRVYVEVGAVDGWESAAIGAYGTAEATTVAEALDRDATRERDLRAAQARAALEALAALKRRP